MIHPLKQYWSLLFISLSHKDPQSQSYGSPSSHVWMWELDHKESWVLKNWCFQIVVLEKTLESPLDCKEINQLILKESWSWSSNTLATWYQDSTHSKRPWCWKILRAGREERKRGWDGWMASWLNGQWIWGNWETVKDRKAWCAAVHGVTKSWT